MRETSFIQQNKEKWQEFEQYLEGRQDNPEELNDLFIQVTDDLSYARTFYPNRSVRVYLNGLAQKVFFNIYKGKKPIWKRFAHFWADDLPQLLYESRKELLLSFFIFALAIAIGMLSGAADPDFARSILGERYVEMTEANINSGDPMAVYKELGAFNMFLGITINNILVALRTFIFGVFYAIGTIGSLLYNGIMLGAFQYFFIEKGLFWESFLAVWLHGAFEISSIVIAGAAGLTMGKGLVQPGTFSRLRSFQLAARRGMSILIGTLPLFVCAGFIESYFTRHTEAPDILRGAFIFLCFAIVLFYFVFLPLRKGRREISGNEKIRLTPDVNREIDFSSIKTVGDLFTDTFIFYRKNFQFIAWAALAGASLYGFIAFGLAKDSPGEGFYYKQGMFSTLAALPQFIIDRNYRLLTLFAALSLSVVVFVIQFRLNRMQQGGKKINSGSSFWKRAALSYLNVLTVVLLLVYLFGTSEISFLFVLPFLPIFFLWTQVIISEKKGFILGLERSLQLTSKVYTKMVGLSFTLLFCGALFLLILDSGSLMNLGGGVIWFLLEVISMNLRLPADQAAIFSAVLITFVVVFVALLAFGLLVAGSGLQYFSSLEIHDAYWLRERIRKIGSRKRIKGLEREG